MADAFLDEMLTELKGMKKGSAEYQRLANYINKYQRDEDYELDPEIANYKRDDFSGLRWDSPAVQALDNKYKKEIATRNAARERANKMSSKTADLLKKGGWDSEESVLAELDAKLAEAAEKFGEGSPEYARLWNYKNDITGEGERMDDYNAGIAWDTADQQAYDDRFKKYAKHQIGNRSAKKAFEDLKGTTLGGKKAEAPTTTGPAIPELDDSKVIEEVWSGKYGQGAERAAALDKLGGSGYGKKIQDQINKSDKGKEEVKANKNNVKTVSDMKIINSAGGNPVEVREKEGGEVPDKAKEMAKKAKDSGSEKGVLSDTMKELFRKSLIEAQEE